jgi:hypothetical protein
VTSAVVAAFAMLATTQAFSEKAVTSTGQALVEEAALQLARHPSLEAKIRQRVNLFGQQLAGSGSYQQVRANGATLIRLELKTQLAGQLTGLQQISDGVTLWIRRDKGGEKSTGYVNLRRIGEAVCDTSSAHFPADALAIGGLQQLLKSLASNFDFGEATADSIGNVPVWVIHGRWKPEELAGLLPEGTNAILNGPESSSVELPSHLPDRVTLTLGRDDFIPLFPYRIEYARRADESRAGGIALGQGAGHADAEPIVTMELFEVRRSLDLDPRLFVHKLGDQHVEDLTPVYMKRFGLIDDEGN